MQRSFSGREDQGLLPYINNQYNRLIRRLNDRASSSGSPLLNSVLVFLSRGSNGTRVALGLVTLLVLSSTLSSLNHVDDGKKKRKGPPPNPVTLVYPYTNLRDVVLNQPVDPSDVPFFWHLHKSDESIIKSVLTKCFSQELVELNTLESIKEAKKANLPSREAKNFVITSPFIRETSDIFTPAHFGRMFCFFRHPLDYDLHEDLPRFEAEDNWLTRLLSNEHKGEIGYKQLGMAKHVIRESCVVGTVDKMTESLVRIGKYFGWDLLDDEVSCIEELVDGNNVEEKYMDHETDEWNEFYEKNQLDCQLYEQAQSTWRAQIQTIVPYEIQVERVNPKKKKGEGDEEEEEEEEAAATPEKPEAKETTDATTEKDPKAEAPKM